MFLDFYNQNENCLLLNVEECCAGHRECTNVPIKGSVWNCNPKAILWIFIQSGSEIFARRFTLWCIGTVMTYFSKIQPSMRTASALGQVHPNSGFMLLSSHKFNTFASSTINRRTWPLLVGSCLCTVYIYNMEHWQFLYFDLWPCMFTEVCRNER